ncbi:MAG: hypothetical protein RL557_567 [archaeon]|jgi:hypothetical protein
MALIMVYPDKRYVERDPLSEGHPCFLDVYERGFTETVSLMSKESFQKRVGLINKLIDNYRRSQKVCWLVFSQKENPSVADTENMHPIYEVQATDLIFPVGISYDDMRKSKYPNESTVLSRLSLEDTTIFGGFHSRDCVKRFATAAQERGLHSSIDYLLTEKWFFTVYESFQHDLYARQIQQGFLDPNMHEDDPEEEKFFLFNGRLPREDLKL